MARISQQEGKVEPRQRKRGLVYVIRRVIEETPEEHRPMLLIVALTGLRVGELLALRWKNVDLVGRRLSVTNTLWLGMLLTPKSKRSQGQIHIPDALANALAAHHVRARFTSADDFVFAREDGSPPGQQHVRDYVLYPALERARIEHLLLAYSVRSY